MLLPIFPPHPAVAYPRHYKRSLKNQNGYKYGLVNIAFVLDYVITLLRSREHICNLWGCCGT